MNSHVGSKSMWVTNAARISRLALARRSGSVLSLCQTSPPTLISLSAQYGAMIIRPSVSLSGNGSDVYWEIAFTERYEPIVINLHMYMDTKFVCFWIHTMMIHDSS